MKAYESGCHPCRLGITHQNRINSLICPLLPPREFVKSRPIMKMVGRGGGDRTQRPKELVRVLAQKSAVNQITFRESAYSSHRKSRQQFTCFWARRRAPEYEQCGNSVGISDHSGSARASYILTLGVIQGKGTDQQSGSRIMTCAEFGGRSPHRLCEACGFSLHVEHDPRALRTDRNRLQRRVIGEPEILNRSTVGARYFTFLRSQSSMNLMTTSLFRSRNISCMLPWMPTSSRRTKSSFTPAWFSHLGMQASNTR